MYVVSSTIIQMVSRGSHHVSLPAGPPWLANPSDTMLAWRVHRLFLFKAFQLFLVNYPYTVVLETLIDTVKLKFFYLSVLICWIITYILTALSIIFLTQFVKKRPWPLSLSSKVFTFDHFFGHRSDFFNNLPWVLKTTGLYRVFQKFVPIVNWNEFLKHPVLYSILFTYIHIHAQF